MERLLRGQLAQIESQIAIQGQQIKSAQALLERIRPLGEGNYISVFEIERQQAVVRDAHSRRSELIRLRLDLQQQLAAAEEALANLPLVGADRRNDIARGLADVSQSQAQNEMERSVLGSVDN